MVRTRCVEVNQIYLANCHVRWLLISNYIRHTKDHIVMNVYRMLS